MGRAATGQLAKSWTMQVRLRCAADFVVLVQICAPPGRTGHVCLTSVIWRYCAADAATSRAMLMA